MASLFACIFFVFFLLAVAWVTIWILAIFLSMGKPRAPRGRNPFAEPVQNEFLTNSRRWVQRSTLSTQH
jgi:hypothetical protein